MAPLCKPQWRFKQQINLVGKTQQVSQNRYCYFELKMSASKMTYTVDKIWCICDNCVSFTEWNINTSLFTSQTMLNGLNTVATEVPLGFNWTKRCLNDPIHSLKRSLWTCCRDDHYQPPFSYWSVEVTQMHQREWCLCICIMSDHNQHILYERQRVAP